MAERIFDLHFVGNSIIPGGEEQVGTDNVPPINNHAPNLPLTSDSYLSADGDIPPLEFLLKSVQLTLAQLAERVGNPFRR